MENKGQGIFYGVIGVATLVVAIIGATFAYFAASAENTTTVTGETSSADLTLAVTKVTTDASGKLVPQYATGLGRALVGTDNHSCVDGNGNTVCQVYEITVTNGGTSAIVVNGTFALSGTVTNLKWTELATATTTQSGFTAGNATSVTAFKSNVTLAATGQSGNSATYYVAVWVEEQGSDQTSADASKSFTGTVRFEGAGGGVTSTFTS